MAGDRLVEPAQTLEGKAKLAMNARDLVIQGGGLAEEIDGNLVFAGLKGEDSQMMKAVDMIGLDLQNLSIELDGVNDPSGALAFKSGAE